MKGKRVLVSIIFSILTLPLLLAPFNFQSAEPSEIATENDLADTNWLSGWGYRKSHILVGSEGAGTNYQIRVVVHYGSGIDFLDHVACHTLCKPDFDDIRFTDDDGVTLLDYWVEASFEFDNATFWVEVMDDLDHNQTIYLYYGNEDASPISDGDDTFIFFDDFEDQDFSEWNLTDGDSWDIVSNYVAQGSYSAYCAGGAVARTLRIDFDGLNHGIMVHLHARVASSLSSSGYTLWGTGTSDTGVHIGQYTGSFRLNTIQYYRGYTYYEWPQNNTYSTNTWYKVDYGMNPDTDKRRAWKDDAYMGEVDLIDSSGENTFANFTQIRVSAGTGFGQNMWIDEYYIRKWVEIEPQHGTWDEPETEITNTTTTTTTTPSTTSTTATTTEPHTTTTNTTTSTTSTGGPGNYWVMISVIVTIGSTIIIIIFIVLIIRNRP